MYSQANILNSYAPTQVLSKVGEPVIYVARHAEVTLDKQDRIRGLVNPGLTEKGKADAQKLVTFFGETPIGGIVTDDLKRTYQTALPLAGAKGITIEVDPRLRSWDVGTELEGKPIEDHEDEITKLKNQPEMVPVAGESWGDFNKKINDSFQEWLRKSMDGDPYVIVTHGSGIQVIWQGLGETTGVEYAEIPIQPAGVAAIYLTREGFKPVIIAGAGENEDE